MDLWRMVHCSLEGNVWVCERLCVDQWEMLYWLFFEMGYGSLERDSVHTCQPH